MQKEYLLELTQRVSDLTGIAMPIVVGSQSLFAITDDVPRMVKESVECDYLLAEGGITAMQVVNEELGILSPFSRAKGYYADGLGLATGFLSPAGGSVCCRLLTTTERP